jgi:curved DNA-binding protein CbpA
MEPPNYYEILQLSYEAEQEVIEAAYKKLAWKYHPDRNPGENDRMHLINEAYEVLRDPVKKEQYDKETKTRALVHIYIMFANDTLDKGHDPNDVIKFLIEGGAELEIAAKVVGTVVESRRGQNDHIDNPNKSERQNHFSKTLNTGYGSPPPAEQPDDRLAFSKTLAWMVIFAIMASIWQIGKALYHRYN